MMAISDESLKSHLAFNRHNIMVFTHPWPRRATVFVTVVVAMMARRMGDTRAGSVLLGAIIITKRRKIISTSAETR